MLLRLLVLAILALATCSTEPDAPGPDATAKAVALFDRARAPLLATNEIPAAPAPLNSRLRMMWERSSSACRPRNGANPVVVLLGPAFPEVRPRVGTRVQFAVLSHYPSTSTPTTFIMAVGTRLLQPAFNLDGSGAPGCQLLVAWDSLTVVQPGDNAGLWHSVGPGRVDFDWTPAAMHANTRWYIQAGIVAPGENAAGLLTTAAVEMWVAP